MCESIFSRKIADRQAMSLTQKMNGKESIIEWRIDDFKENTDHSSATFQIDGYNCNIISSIYYVSGTQPTLMGLKFCTFSLQEHIKDLFSPKSVCPYSFIISVSNFSRQTKGKILIGNGQKQILTIFHDDALKEIPIFVTGPTGSFSMRRIVTVRCTFVREQDAQGESSLLSGNRNVDRPLHGSTCFLEHATQTEILHPCLMKDVSTSTDAEESSLLETLSENLISFYDNKTNTDCVIKVRKSQFPIHRAVMSARSAVFAAMFNHDTTEKLSGEVDIPDIEPTTFSDILFYVYSGKIRGLTHDTAVSMYTFADKYALYELRDKCLEVLLNCLSTENVCDAAVLAHTHGETTLENEVIHFIAERLEEFMESDKWRQFAHDKCLLANKLLCSALIVCKKKNIEGKC